MKNLRSASARSRPAPARLRRIAAKFGTIALGVIVILVLAAALYVRQFDAQQYAESITEFIREETGRELVVDGAIRLRGFPTPRIIAEQLRLSNVSWGSAPTMLSAKRLELELSPFSLLMGQYSVKRLMLEEPAILLERHADGRANWDFVEQDSTSAGDPIPITLSRVLMRNASVLFKDGPSGTTFEFPVRVLSLSETFASDRLRVDIKASYKEHPIGVAGNIGRWLTLMRDEPFEFTLRIKGFDASANLVGTIDTPLDGTGLSMDMTLQAESTQTLDKALGFDLPPAGPLRGNARVTEENGIVRLDDLDMTTDVSGGSIRMLGTITNLFALDGMALDLDVTADSMASIAKLGGRELPAIGPVKATAKLLREGETERLPEFQATVGNTELSGSLAWERLNPRLALSGELRSSHLDLKQVLPEEQPLGDRLFSAEPLRFEALQHVDAQIRLEAAQMVARRFSFEDLSVDIDLNNGRLRLNPAGNFAEGPFSVDLEVDATSTPPAVSARVSGDQISLAQVSEGLREVPMVQGGKVEVRAKVASRGDSVREIMANLNGNVRLSLVDARVQNAILEHVSRDVVTEFLRFLRSADEQEGMTDLHCAVVNLPVREGVVEVKRSIAMESPDVNMSASGVIDLRDESLDLGVLLMRPNAIDIAKGSLADLARIQGTLLNPEVEADVTRAAVTVITGGVALLAKSLFDELTKDTQPCRTALEYQAPTSDKEKKVAATHEQRGREEQPRPAPRE